MSSFNDYDAETIRQLRAENARLREALLREANAKLRELVEWLQEDEGNVDLLFSSMSHEELEAARAALAGEKPNE
jgi:DNA-binding protein H-NS